ncbi:hypothetical protein [Chitinophaga sp. YIM B06452]|uniref:hypothetical protein n=1 Tax=Chitinophaga sp. YIM B06452 TaxID=3082158 RepID=UPI0031FEA44C
MEVLVALGAEDLHRLAEAARRLERRISFSEYLLHHQFTRLEDGYFAKTSPPQLIQLIEKDGQCYYINHAMNGDSGRLMEFIMHRLSPNGKIIPLYGIRISELLTAVDIARLYVQDVSRVNKKGGTTKANLRKKKGGSRP